LIQALENRAGARILLGHPDKEDLVRNMAEERRPIDTRCRRVTFFRRNHPDPVVGNRSEVKLPAVMVHRKDRARAVDDNDSRRDL
jgi:hypothetical protein